LTVFADTTEKVQESEENASRQQLNIAEVKRNPVTTPAWLQDSPGSTKGDHLTSGAIEVGQLTEILPLYELLAIKQKEAQELQQERDTLQELRARQKVLYLHGKLNQYFLTANAEAQAFKAKIDSEMSQLYDIKAAISSDQLKVQHRISFVNLISGGLTKLGGYGSALAGAGDLPVNILETFDGAVQTGLSSIMLKHERRERKVNAASPEIVTAFITGANEPPPGFPDIVWKYVNAPVPGARDGKTRRQLLLESWISMGRVTQAPVGSHNTGHKQEARLMLSHSAESDIDIALAMASDIKSLLSSLESSLLELSQALRETYSNDPEF
jgi:hypothetical protein